MSSLLVEPPGGQLRPVRGVQTPRIASYPPFEDTSGTEVSDWLAANGLTLDPWQRLVFEKALLERDDGSWAAFEVGLTVGRQNGKSFMLAVRELAGMFLFGEELIIHTAHQWKTAHKSFLLLRKIARSSPDLMSRIQRFSSQPGTDVMLMKDGRSVEFIARSKDSGVGWSADLVIMDEAYNLTAEQMGALMPTILAMPNPQIWYASSAPKADSEMLHELRERAIAGGSPRLCYMEWSAPEGCDPTDRQAWAQAAPSLGIRITEDRYESLQGSMKAHEFGRECLGWPDLPAGGSVFPAGSWNACSDPASEITGLPTFALEVAEDRSWACVAAAGPNRDGFCHVEYGQYRQGTAWVIDWITDLASRRSVRVVVQPSSPAGSLIADLEARKVTVVKATAQDYAQGCGAFYDSVADKRDIRHTGQEALEIAVKSAQQRRSADAWVWDRRNPNVDISPLAAVTLAAWGFRQKPARTGRFIAF